jgi:hypothetical protein
MFRFILPVVFLFAASANADEIPIDDLRVTSVNAIYREATDDVLLRVTFDRPPELPLWMVAWEIWRNDNFDSLVSVRGDQIDSLTGTIPVGRYDRANGWTVISSTEAAYLIDGIHFSTVVPFSVIQADSHEFFYGQVIICKPGDDPIYQENYATINVPEPSGIVLAILAIIPLSFVSSSRIAKRPSRPGRLGTPRQPRANQP